MWCDLLPIISAAFVVILKKEVKKKNYLSLFTLTPGSNFESPNGLKMLVFAPGGN